MKNRYTFIWLLFCVSAFIFSMGISWQFNRTVNFAYPIWYELLDIQSHIKHYSPQNQFNKQDFASTSSEQHFELFAAIVTLIHKNGEGLSAIFYVNEKGTEKRFLTPNEVTHLTDVSHLVQRLQVIWFINLLPLFVCCYLYLKKKLKQPRRYHKNLFIGVITISLTLSLALFDFADLFYSLHRVIFPKNHQWFFYYEESLMTTLMKAPDLFAAIGSSLSIIGVVIYLSFYHLIFKKIKS